MGLESPSRRRLIQDTETKAVLLAILEKKKVIKDLEKVEGISSQEINSRLVLATQMRLSKKLNFKRKCDSTKFSQ